MPGFHRQNRLLEVRAAFPIGQQTAASFRTPSDLKSCGEIDLGSDADVIVPVAAIFLREDRDPVAANRLDGLGG